MTPERRQSPGGEPEALSNNTNIAGGDTAQSTAAEPVHGGDIGAATANPSHLAELIAMIEAKAAGGRYVCACLVYTADHVGELDSVQTVGAAFRTAALHGVIKPIGYHRATRSARQSGVHAQWVGVVA